MNILKVLFVILFCILTVFTIKLHPEIHQPMLIEDANFKLERISDNLPEATVQTNYSEPKKLVTQVIDTEKPIIQTKEIESNIQKSSKIEKQIQQVVQKPVQKNIQKNIKTEDLTDLQLLEEIFKRAQNIELPQEIQQSPKMPQQQQKNQSIPKQQINVSEPKPVQKIVQQPKSEHKNPYMTEQEEIIAWNKWRSNLQNQIMRDSNIDYAPLGTLFTFTFLVDKFGNVSNIKVECSNPNFMDIARNNVKPAISRLQRKPILNFPMGTQRTTTVVVGSFLIGTQERFSSPDDYADFERVVH